MRIAAITPIHVGHAELARRQRRYDRLAPPGVTVHLTDLPGDRTSPRALETGTDIRRSEELVIAHARRVPAADYDLVLPDCVLDPGVGVATDTPLPLLGIFQLAAHLLVAVRGRFAAVTRNEAIAGELSSKARAYGLGDWLTEVRVLGLDVAAIPDDAAWHAAITAAAADVGAETVVNGCSAVDVHLSATGPRVVDPTRAALRVLGSAAELGLVPGPRLGVR